MFIFYSVNTTKHDNWLGVLTTDVDDPGNRLAF
jgi:hypothetical protein